MTFHQLPADLREAVLTRDGGCKGRGWRQSCYGPLAVHHILPWGSGGPDEMENLVSLCQAHHSLAHHLPWESIPLGLLRRAHG